MADSIDSPLLNIAPLNVERVGETKRKGESRNQKHAFPALEKKDSDEKNKGGDQREKEGDTIELKKNDQKKRNHFEAQSDKKPENPDGTGLVIDIIA
jgi:hypothetical protein